jgi:hypothetical protein
MHRRRFLGVLGTATALGLAGCSADQPGTATATPPASPTRTTPPATSPTAATPTLTTPSPPGTPTALQNGSFEGGLAGWLPGTDVPLDPNTGEPVATDVAVRAGGTVDVPAASDGDHVLELFVDGSQDDGTVWVQQQADLRGADRLAVDVFSEQESFNTVTKVAVYAGALPDTPLREVAFDTSRPAENHAGWQTFEYPVPPERHGLVAVGVSVVWETPVTRYLDAVRLV